MIPIISLVSGTWNRRVSLARMVNSFRANIPRGIAYEIILVDGGSTDGTIEWAKQQPDVTLIEQGELLGAIWAFDAGAYAATGEYVLLANDDVVFVDNSIIPALTHLEDNPLCGAVAFQDDRPSPGYGEGFKVQYINVLHKGKDTSAVYAQVGLFRRWLGNEAGWWGSTDPIMGSGHTYGGDNFLSARIWELGYTVDAVEAAKVFDTVTPDGLREHNHQQEQRNPGMYYKRYPTPPVIRPAPMIDNPQGERLRVLYMPIYERGYHMQQQGKRGLREALQRCGLVYEIDYVNSKYNLPAAVKAFQPHLLLTQAHAPDSIPIKQIAAAREACPEMVVVNWNGDVYTHGLTTPEMLAYLQHFDIQLVVNDSVLPDYQANGINAAYWQVAYEPVDDNNLPAMPAHDVVFLGNAYSEPRQQLGRMLQNMQGVNVGLYGRGWKWGNGDTTYNFPAGTALYQNSKIAIGDNQYQDQRGFVSNRLFEALAAGAFLLHQTIPGLEELTGLVDGVHYVAFTDLNDLQRKVQYWLQTRRIEKRIEIAAAGRAFVRQHHSFDARVDELLGLLEGIPA